MKKAIYRVIAFSLDLLLCTVIVYGLSLLSFVNPNADKIKNEFQMYNEEIENYEKFNKDLDKYLEDGIIREDELSEINGAYPNYVKLFDGIVVNDAVSEKKKSEIREDIEPLHNKILNDYAYNATRYNYIQTILYTVVFIAYFGVLQFFMNGQTIFKRIFRLKVVDKSNSKKSLTLVSYIIRALLVTELVMTLIDTTLLYTLKESTYIASNYWIGQIKYLYEMAFLICIVIRDDQRSVHDLILNTRVIRYDKNMNEIEEQIFNTIEEEKEESVKKVDKKKKEVVKALKVNDKKNND